MMPRSLALLTALLAGGAVLAQTALAERQIKAAQDLERDGQVAQARQVYEQVAAKDAESPWADDALLALARLDWPLSDPDELASAGVDQAALASARAHLEELKARFPDSDSAPEAAWRLALLRLLPGSEHFDREEAVALLSTLPTLYPEAKEVPWALGLAARLQLLADRKESARRLAFELLSRFPDFPRRGRAWLVLARSEFLDGKVPEALAALGEAQLSAGDDRPTFRLATDLATTLDRLAYGATRGGNAFELDKDSLVVAPGKLSGLAFDPEGRLAAVMPREGEVLVWTPGEPAPERRQMPGIRAVAYDSWGRQWLASDTGLMAPGGLVFSLPEGAEITSLAPSGPRSVWVVNRDANAVLRLTAGGAPAVSAELAKRTSPRAVVEAPFGGAFILDAKQKSLVHVGADGKSLHVVSLAELVQSPVDLGIDAFGRLYVLDAKNAVVIVLTAAGELMHRIALPRDGEISFAKALALAVDRSGQIVVYEGRKRRLGWWR